MEKQDIDVINQYTGEKWYYTDIVKDHFFHPRNLLWERPKDENEYDAHGMVGSPACGDMMEMWLKVDKATERVKDLKWKTFGCASAIAATSMFSAMVTENDGLSIEDALKQAKTLGVECLTLSIECAFEAFLKTLKPIWGDKKPNIIEENIQARIRGILLMALSNHTGKMVLTTSNKSESAVGYTTLYGDMCGGLSVIKDVNKNLVYELARYRNAISLSAIQQSQKAKTMMSTATMILGM